MANLQEKIKGEKTYSEEEVLSILEDLKGYLETFIYQYIDKQDMEDVDQWFEQYKK